MHAAIPPTLARAGTAHAAPTASAVGKPPTLIASTSSFSVLDTTWSAAGATFGPLVVPPNLRRGDSDFGLVSGWTDAPTGAAGASIARPASLLHVPNRTATATPLAARANAPGSPGASVLDALFALRLPPAPPATPVPVQQQQQQQPTNKWLSALVPPALERHYSAPPATIPAAAAAAPAAPAPDDDEKAGLATLAALDLLATAADTTPPAQVPRTQQAATMTNAYHTPPTRTLYPSGNDAFGAAGSTPGTPVAPVPARPAVTAADAQQLAAAVGVASPSASSYTPAPEWRHVQAGAPVTPATPMRVVAQPNTNPSTNVAVYAAPALGPADAGGLPYTASTTWGGPYASGYSLGSPAKDSGTMSVASPPPPLAMPVAAAGFNQYRPPVAEAYAPPPLPPIPQQATTTAAQYQPGNTPAAHFQPTGEYAASAPQQAEPFAAQYQQYPHQMPAGGNAGEFTVPGTAAVAAGHNQYQVPTAGMVEYGTQTVNAPSAVYNQYQAQLPGGTVGEYASPPSTTTISGYNQYQPQQGGIGSDYATSAPTGFNQHQPQHGTAVTSDYSMLPLSTATSYNQYQPPQGASTANNYSVPPATTATTATTAYNLYQSPPSSTITNDFSAPATSTTGFNQYQSPLASSATAYNQYQPSPSSTGPSTTYSTTTAAPYSSTTTTAGYYSDASPPQTYIPGLPPGVVSAGPTSTLGSPPMNVYTLPPPPPLMDYGPRCTQCGVYVDAPGPACAHPPTCQVCLFASPKPCANCTSVSLLEPVKYPVVKMSNIPWDVTQRDIQDYFSPTQIPSIGGLPLVHVLMVRESGKTKSDAFVELPTISHLGEALQERQRRILRGRIVTLTPSSQEELMRAVFPAFPGSWNGVDALPAVEEQTQTHGAPVAAAGPGTHGTPTAAATATNVYRGPFAAAVANDPAMTSSWASWSDASSLGSWTAGETSAGSSAAADTLATSPPSTTSTAAATAGSAQHAHASPPSHPPAQQGHQQHRHVQHQQQQYPPCFLTRNEINQILAVCKNYKLFFSRKCAQRPFENVVTILLKFPWHQRALVSTLQRDHLFEMAKLCIESLHQHLIKPYHQIDPSLMDRLLRAVLMVPAFTEKQKMIVLDASGHACPQAFTHLLTPPGHAAAGAGGPPGSLADVGHGHGARERVPVDETEAGHAATTELAAAVGEAHEHEHDDDVSYLASESPPGDHLHDAHENEHDDHPTPTTKTLTPTLALAPAPVPTQPTINHHQQWASILRNANAAPAASHEHGAVDTELRAALARAHGTIARLEGTVLAYELRVKQLERELAAERAHHGLAVAAENHARQVAREPPAVESPTQLVVVVAERGAVAAVGGGGEVRPSGAAV